MECEKIRQMVANLTLEEKAALTSGKDNWYTKSIERLGIPSVRTSDGPHGLRTQAGEVNSLEEGSSETAICFPAACATAASFDRELLKEMGEELGREAKALGVDVILGPGVNMKRSPLCGRNFEYFSEDPYLAGALGTAFVQGVQSQGVGTSLKHFAANNQEHRRMDSSSEMDERTFREIYLPAFEAVIKDAQPWTVMASYNKIGGTYSTQNSELLTEILRKEWGFEGVVTSDWGAVHDRTAAIAAGCDLTMPAEATDEQIVCAVGEGRLSEEALDACCMRLICLAMKAAENRTDGEKMELEKGHELARKIAGESMVLLKNKEKVLPLKETKNIAFLGEFAEKPRYQGGGSSHINSFRTPGTLETARKKGMQIRYAKGYLADGTTNEFLLEEARKIAKQADKVVVFIGLIDAMESEGIDRRNMKLPKGHEELIQAVCEIHDQVIVVLHNGAPVEMPWIEQVEGLVEAYLAGEAAGEAVVDLLTGEVNPSGRLAESFPIRLEDNPSYLSYFGEGGTVHYQEGLFIGYRYYESKKQDVLFPFGYGLSYTDFSYENLRVNKTELEENEPLEVSVDVTNVGSVIGKTVVQLYIAPEKAEMIRPSRELKAFEKIELAPGEKKTVMFRLDSRAFSHWNPSLHEWKSEEAFYGIQIGKNAHEIVLETRVFIQAEPIVPQGGYSLEMPMDEFAKSHRGRNFLDENIIYMIRGMIEVGFIPAEMGVVLDQISEKVGRGSGETGGVQVLMGQPLGILDRFLPKEKKEQLKQLLIELDSGSRRRQ